MSENVEVPPGLRAMTDRVMAECAELLPHNVAKLREALDGGMDRAEIMERFVVEAADTITDLSQPLIMLCAALLRIADLERAAEDERLRRHE